MFFFVYFSVCSRARRYHEKLMRKVARHMKPESKREQAGEVLRRQCDVEAAVEIKKQGRINEKNCTRRVGSEATHTARDRIA